MDILGAIAGIAGGATLLGYVIRGSNMLTEIKVMVAHIVKENDEHRAHRGTTDQTLSNHENRIRNLESGFEEFRGEQDGG